MQSYEERTYRSFVTPDSKFESFRVVVQETDLLIRANCSLVKETRDLILKHRLPLERYLEKHPDFFRSLTPLPIDAFAPKIVKTMMLAGQKAGVGPMSSVAGAIAEYVGKDLLKYSKDVIVENGGDVFMRSDFPLTVGLFAGESLLSNKVGVRINASEGPMAVCTSSGTVGHSLSFGKADAVTVISESSSLADAAATSIGNSVLSKRDLANAIEIGKEIDGMLGIVIIVEGEIGLWGEVELVKLS